MHYAICEICDLSNLVNTCQILNIKFFSWLENNAKILRMYGSVNCASKRKQRQISKDWTRETRAACREMWDVSACEKHAASGCEQQHKQRDGAWVTGASAGMRRTHLQASHGHCCQAAVGGAHSSVHEVPKTSHWNENWDWRLRRECPGGRTFECFGFQMTTPLLSITHNYKQSALPTFLTRCRIDSQPNIFIGPTFMDSYLISKRNF